MRKIISCLLCMALGLVALNAYYLVWEKEVAVEEQFLEIQEITALIPRWFHSMENVADLLCALPPQPWCVSRFVQLQRQKDCNEVLLRNLRSFAETAEAETTAVDGALIVLWIRRALTKARSAAQAETKKLCEKKKSSRTSKEEATQDSASPV